MARPKLKKWQIVASITVKSIIVVNGENKKEALVNFDSGDWTNRDDVNIVSWESLGEPVECQ